MRLHGFPCSGGVKSLGPRLVYGIYWASKDTKLGAHTKGPRFGF